MAKALKSLEKRGWEVVNIHFAMDFWYVDCRNTYGSENLQLRFELTKNGEHNNILHWY